jgi:protein-S-isoprenylcysteine O-methyltransferase Ste14
VTEAALWRILLWTVIAIALVVAPTLIFIPAPYGRHARRGWGPSVASTLGWIVMEAPSPLGMALLFALGERRDPTAVAFLLLWELHYVHRAFVFPLRRPAGRPLPIVVVAMGFTFNCLNAYLNGRWLFHFAPASAYPAAWLLDPRFLAGAALFLVGLGVNFHADEILRRLRRPGETGYRIPTGGLYRLVSSPNYLGETLEWCGWALATWALPGAAFALFTAANLAPRAVAHHRWYRATFPDYPPERRALIPWLL